MLTIILSDDKGKTLMGITRGWWPEREATEDELMAMRDTTHLDYPQASAVIEFDLTKLGPEAVTEEEIEDLRIDKA